MHSLIIFLFQKEKLGSCNAESCDVLVTTDSSKKTRTSISISVEAKSIVF